MTSSPDQEAWKERVLAKKAHTHPEKKALKVGQRRLLLEGCAFAKKWKYFASFFGRRGRGRFRLEAAESFRGRFRALLLPLRLLLVILQASTESE